MALHFLADRGVTIVAVRCATGKQVTKRTSQGVEIDSVINMSPNAGNYGTFQPDDQMPGLPASDGVNNGIAGEVVTYLELPAGATTMAVASDDAAMGCDTSRCENPDSQCCNGEPCIDVNSNPLHCGGCGKVCGNREVCASGSCICRGGGRDQACTAGTLCCFDGCRDVMKDTMNCGGCNRVCVAGETCDGGTCKCGPAGLSCRSGQTCCGSGCSNLIDDPKNCGKCGKECPMGKACKGGVCEGECAVPCGGVERCCDGMCVNVLNNPQHCGGCGRDCKVLSPFPIPGCLVGNCIDLRMMDMAMPADMSMPMDMSTRD